jgi:hypothetical protein
MAALLRQSHVAVHPTDVAIRQKRVGRYRPDFYFCVPKTEN